MAQEGYQPLVGIPFVEGGGGLSAYFNALYVAAISLAALIAVIKIIVAGVKYMLSDVVTNKESAKKDIRTALLGLLIIVSAVLILETINPQLTNFELTFERPDPPPAVQGPTGGSSTNPDGTPKDPVEEFGPSDYNNILAAFTSLEGNVRTARPDAYCTAEANESSGEPTIAYDICMRRVWNSMNDYCLHNAGNFRGDVGVSTEFSCTLPTEVRTADSFQDEFEQRKTEIIAELNASSNQEDRRRAIELQNTDDMDEEMYEYLCGRWGGQFKDTELTSRWGVDDYKCVKF